MRSGAFFIYFIYVEGNDFTMQNIKGTYDFFGTKQKLRQYIQDTLRQTFELYDCEPMESTVLTELEILTSKYAGGDEILKEMYQLTDQGGRALGLRYDLTIPFAKVISLNPQIKLPYKRYEIGKVFRDGPTKRGRLREFLQCDVDVVGVSGLEAEAELMQLAIDVFQKLDIKIILRWNNRQLLSEWLEAVGVLKDQLLSVMLTLDKKDKIGVEAVTSELMEKGIASTAVEGIHSLLLQSTVSIEQLISQFNLQQSKGGLETLQLMSMMNKMNFPVYCKFDPFLSRGLSFYTGTVYEIFDATNNFTSSLAAGGRYDKIIGQLINNTDCAYPAVGLSFGIESITTLLEERNKELCTTPVVIISFGNTVAESLHYASLLRAENIRVRVDTSQRKLRKLLPALASSQIKYVLIVGEHEAINNCVKFKNMFERTESTVTIDEAIYMITS